MSNLYLINVHRKYDIANGHEKVFGKILNLTQAVVGITDVKLKARVTVVLDRVGSMHDVVWVRFPFWFVRNYCSFWGACGWQLYSWILTQLHLTDRSRYVQKTEIDIWIAMWRIGRINCFYRYTVLSYYALTN